MRWLARRIETLGWLIPAVVGILLLVASRYLQNGPLPVSSWLAIGLGAVALLMSVANYWMEPFGWSALPWSWVKRPIPSRIGGLAVYDASLGAAHVSQRLRARGVNVSPRLAERVAAAQADATHNDFPPEPGTERTQLIAQLASRCRLPTDTVAAILDEFEREGLRLGILS